MKFNQFIFTIIQVIKYIICLKDKSDHAEISNFNKNLDSEISSMSSTDGTSSEDNSDTQSEDSNQSLEKSSSPSQKCLTLPPKLDIKQIDWDELDELLQVERVVDDSDKLYQTMPNKQMHQSNVDLINQANQADPIDSMFNLSRSMIETSNKIDCDESTQFSKSCDKSPRPIDPSRINDSLKLYSENVNKNNNLSDIYMKKTLVQTEVLTENVGEKLISASSYDSDDDTKYYLNDEIDDVGKPSEENMRKNKCAAIKRRSGKRR